MTKGNKEVPKEEIVVKEEVIKEEAEIAPEVLAVPGEAPAAAPQGRREKSRGQRRSRAPRVQKEAEFLEKVVSVNRVAKVVKGGKNFSFSALVVVGDGKGRVGFSLGKAREVQDAIRKGVQHAKNGMSRIPMKGTTIPHEVMARFGAARVFLKPALQGTGVIAGSATRAVCECAGIKDILTKSLGSETTVNVVRAVIMALQNMVVDTEDNPVT